MSPKPWEVTDDDLAQGNVPAAPATAGEGQGEDYLLHDNGDDEFEELNDPWSSDPQTPAAKVPPARPIEPRTEGQKPTAPAAKAVSTPKPAKPSDPPPQEPSVESRASQGQETEQASQEQAPESELSADTAAQPSTAPDSPASPSAPPAPAPEPPDPADAFDDADDFDTFWDEPVAPSSGAPAVAGYDLGPSPAGAPSPSEPTVPVLGMGAATSGEPAGDTAETDDDDPDDSITVTLRRTRETQTARPSREYRTSTESRRPVRPSERRHKMDAAVVKQGPFARMKKKLSGDADRSRAHETSAKRDTIRPLNVVVLGKKGGVGKTVITTLLGHTFASVRKDRVLAVDASPTGGNLSARCPKEGRGTVVSLLDQLEYVTAYANVREHTAKGDTGLEVLGSDVTRPQRPVTGDDYRQLMDELRRHYQLILSDTPGDITTASADGEAGIVPALLDEADLLVLVAEGVDGANAATWLVNWLKERIRATDDRHLERLLDDLIVVVTSRSPKTNAKPERMAKYFSEEIARRVVLVPFDPVVEGGLEIDYTLISPKTRKAMLELADAVTGSDAFTGR